jgi:serine/threonine protein kinase
MLGVRAEPAQLGRYRLLRKIAVGGMAEIYLARVSGAGGFEKDVVVKRILPQLAESDEFFAMFLDEARIAATLQHPNLVQIFDAGQAGSEFFIAMEYLEGADLQTVRRVLAGRQRGMPLQHALFIVSSIAAGLHHAHEKLGLDGRPLEIVHRDVTPQNVFLTREGGVKLVDFGIAKATNRMATTSHGTLKGKLAYMSPEQCRAEQVDRRSDVYSLGVLLYELTTGRRPYRGKSEYELLREIVEGEVPPPTQMVSGYPVDLEAIVMRSLAHDREARLPSALALVQELERFARRHSLVGSTLTLVEFLEPLLCEAQRQSEARHLRRMSTAPPPFEEPELLDPAPSTERWTAEPWAESEADRLDTVAAQPRHHDRPGSSRPGSAESDSSRDVDLLPEASADSIEEPSEDVDLSSLDAAIVAGAVPRAHSYRSAQVLLVAILLAAGGAAAALHYHGRGQADGHDPGAGALAEEEAPRAGLLHVTSDPPGAAIWLKLGRSPAEIGPIDPSRAHIVRVEQDGYRAREVTVGPEAFAGGASLAEVPIELKLAGASEVLLPEPTTMPEGDLAPTRAARIRVTTQPEVAVVWMLVGVTPAVLPVTAESTEQELRVSRTGYVPAFATATPHHLGPDGQAHLAIALIPRAEPSPRAASSWAQVREIQARAGR